MTEKKKCKTCGANKDVSEFYPVSKTNSRPRTECKTCARKRVAKYWKEIRGPKKGAQPGARGRRMKTVG